MFPLVVGMQVMFRTVDRLHVEENDDKVVQSIHQVLAWLMAVVVFLCL